MKTWLFCVALIAFVPVNALAQETLVSFNAGIGVIPVQGTTGTSPNLVVVQNIVRGVNPPPLLGGSPVYSLMYTPTEIS
jgi:hypothetical protein